MAETSNVTEFSVSELSLALKRTVEDAYGYVRVRGEVSGYRGPHASGHCYFALKDDRARLEAVIWRGAFGRLKFRPEEGLEVIATGKLTTYPGSSKYQIVIEALEPAGVGALMALLEDRRRKLAAEGLFAAERKRPLPYLPRVIGVVTSPTGAVIRDILHRIADRFPVHVLVWPVRVQGEASSGEVAAAIRGFNALSPGGAVPRPDVLIVARGGGSLEDLWGFNEESVVRAAAESRIPLISAIGHETDWTLIDHAADYRAPTPTGAAEVAVPVRSELMAASAGLSSRLDGSLARFVETRRAAARAAARALPRPRDILALPRQRLDHARATLAAGLATAVARHRASLERIGARHRPEGLLRLFAHERRALQALAGRALAALTHVAGGRRERLTGAAARLRPDHMARAARLRRERLAELERRVGAAAELRAREAARRLAGAADMFRALNYHSVLARGFALVRDDAGIPVKSAATLKPGAALDIEFADGHARAVAAGGEAGSGRPKPQASAKSGQGSLF